MRTFGLIYPRLLIVLGAFVLMALTWRTLPLVRPQAIMAGSSEDQPFLFSFWPSEHNAQGTYRWTDGAAHVRLFGYEYAQSTVVGLQLSQSSTEPRRPLTLLDSGGRVLAQTDVTNASRVFQVVVPAPAGAWTTPELTLAGPTFRVAVNDGRDLGVVLQRVTMAPIAGVRLAALLARLACFLTLGLIVYELIRRIATVELALIAGLLLVLLLVALTRRRPVLLAYWLPQLWPLSLPVLVALYGPRCLHRLHPLLQAHRWLSGLSGLGLAVLGAGLLWLHQPPLLGFALLGLGAVAVGSGATAGAEPLVLRVGLLMTMVAVGLALVARFYELGIVPFGLWRDEARYGLLAIRILHEPGFRPVYVPGGVDYPALLFYLQAAVIKFVGIQVISVRSIAALAGALTPIPLFWFGRRLVGSRAAALAGVLIAVSAWHISISRISFVAVLDPLFTMTGLALLWSALDHIATPRRAYPTFVLAGLTLGLALYTYHTARLMPVVALLVVVTVLGQSRTRWQQALPGLFLTVGIGIVVAWPLLQYARDNAASFNLRLRQTSMLTQAATNGLSPVALFNNNVRAYLLMWHLAGEPNARHYIPGRPMLDPLMGALALCGVLLTLRHWRRPMDRLLLAWLVIGAIPALLSEGAPHAVRSVAMIAPAMLLAGRALSAVWERLRGRQGWALAGGSLAVMTVFNFALYFGTTPYNPRVWSKFYGPETMIGEYVRTSPHPAQIVVTAQVAGEDAFQYLASGLPVQVLAPKNQPSRMPAGTEVLLPADASKDEQRWAIAMTGQTTPTAMHPYPGSTQPTFWRYIGR